MINLVWDYIRKHNIIEDGDRIVVGVSGGADSVCLLFVLLDIRERMDIEIMAVHVEHGLRGEESLKDQRFVEELCGRLGVKVVCVGSAVKELAAVERMSTEEAGRNERYRIFNEIAGEYGFDKIAVAHHQNDQAETVLWNLFRGSRLKGLGGMEPVRGNVIRPLLCVKREEILQFLEQRGILFCEDITNEMDIYTRNKIRHHVLDYAKEEINSETVRHVAEAAEELRELRGFICEEADRRGLEILQQDGDSVVIDIGRFCAEPVFMQKYLLRMALERVNGSLKDIKALHIEMLRDLAYGQSGREVRLPYGIIGTREFERLSIFYVREGVKKIASDVIDVSIPGVYHVNGMTVSFSYEGQNIESLEKNIYTKYLDYDTIKDRLQIRKRLPGDYFVMNSQGQRKKLKAYFTEKKIPRSKRNEIWLLADGSHILWIIGDRISEAARAGSITKKIFIVKIYGGTHDRSPDRT